MIEQLATQVDAERTRLRIVEPRDLQALLDVNGDVEVTRFLPYETWRSLEDAEAWYARMATMHDEGRARQFVLCERADDRAIGTVIVFAADAAHRRAEIGYALGRSLWGRGLMREGIASLVDRLFADLALNRVEAFVDPRNAPSRRLLAALGFEHEGTMRSRAILKGAVVDSCVYGRVRPGGRDPASIDR